MEIDADNGTGSEETEEAATFAEELKVNVSSVSHGSCCHGDALTNKVMRCGCGG